MDCIKMIWKNFNINDDNTWNKNFDGNDPYFHGEHKFKIKSDDFYILLMSFSNERQNMVEVYI